MNRARKRRKRLGLPPYGNNVMGVDIPNKMQRRFEVFLERTPGEYCTPGGTYLVWRRSSPVEPEPVKPTPPVDPIWEDYWKWREMKRKK